jgi:hypothetical protein
VGDIPAYFLTRRISNTEEGLNWGERAVPLKALRAASRRVAEDAVKDKGSIQDKSWFGWIFPVFSASLVSHACGVANGRDMPLLKFEI